MAVPCQREVVYAFVTVVNIVIDFLGQEYELPYDVLNPGISLLMPPGRLQCGYFC